MFVSLYGKLTRILGPLIDLYLLKRKMIGKEDPERFKERLGHAAEQRPGGRLIWIHTASVGETVSIIPLVRKFKEDYPDIHILLTSVTVNSAAVIERRLKDEVIHQYAPVDKIVTVRRFLEYWKPSLAFFTESELWPNLITETKRRGCKLILLNARMSDNSFAKWKRFEGTAKKLLGCFSLCLAQSEEDGKKFEELGAGGVKNIGNLKFDAPVLPADPEETGKLLTAIGERKLWIAASTHEGEETLIAEIHGELKKTFPDILTVIIPRHIERGGAIKRSFNENIRCNLRSKNEKIEPVTDMYIADTLGESGIFFRLSGIVFMGGSLTEDGGHNPLEAIRLESAVLSGSNIKNFKEVYEELIENNACIIIHSKEELAGKLITLFSDPDLQEKLSAAALTCIEKKKGMIERYMEEITPYLGDRI